MITTASIVLYKTDTTELKHIYKCLFGSKIISKLILIDNSPDERLKDIIIDEKVKYVFTGKNLGYGSGHNIALREILDQSDYHLVINADVSFKSEIIGKILDFMKSNPDVGHMMPKVLYPNGKIQPLAKLLPNPFDMFLRGFASESWFSKSREKFLLTFTHYDKIMNVPYLSGCFMFLRTEALKKAGLFDERFFLYPEDLDLTRRIHENYKTIFYPEVTIIHRHAKESAQSIKLFIVLFVNIFRYFNKWGWFFDKKRQEINQKVLRELNYYN